MVKFLIGLALGFILAYNYTLNDITYRISFYGYRKEGNQVVPYVKLRKYIKDKGFEKTFNPLDEGVPLEVGEIPIRGYTEFTDQMACEVLKERYCK